MLGRYYHDGTGWVDLTAGGVIPPQVNDYASSATYMPVDDAVCYLAIAIAGGESGQRGNSGAVLGGFGGIIAWGMIEAASLNPIGETVTVGAGGSASGGSKKAGGSSSFGAHVIAPGTPLTDTTPGSGMTISSYGSMCVGWPSGPGALGGFGTDSPLAAGSGGGYDGSSGVIRSPGAGGMLGQYLPYFPKAGNGGAVTIAGTMPGGGGGARWGSSGTSEAGASGLVRVVAFFTDPRI